MHVLIVGCGRTGRELAIRLASEGDAVSIVDVDPAVAAGLTEPLRKRLVEGSALSRTVLERAGIAETEAVVSVTADDSVNAVVARVARERYKVPRVVVRRFDPAKAQIYRLLGITAVSTVEATVNRIAGLLHRHRFEESLRFGSGETLLVRAMVPPYLAGRPVRELNVPGEIQVVEVTRSGRSTVPEPASLLAEHDLASFVVAAPSLARLRGFLDEGWS